MMPLVISFFTRQTSYQAEVERLRDSCERFGLESLILPLESKGSWEENCAMKGPFVREQLNRIKRPILWIDADGEIVAPLTYFDSAAFDFGCHVRWSLQKQPPELDSPGAPFMSGTVFVNNTEGGRKLAERWTARCEEDGLRWDQVSLALAWWDLRGEMDFRLLPQGYCKVFDHIWRDPVKQ